MEGVRAGGKGGGEVWRRRGEYIQKAVMLV